ncbi:hypothetical protein Tsubulata_033344 [Turnera subulata]|uniref:Uncharacterized protein n=1 Tax=Turnera subulata TaxID=218843 RepID=A0A9Q0JP85_9ROSI|nr:hypothetical protein Tsubulata_033344 [Turnera subulata]
MAASVDSPSPIHLNKESTTSGAMMVSSPLFSPASDKRLWSALRSRIDTILESKQHKVAVGQDQLNLEPSSSSHQTVGESDRAKRMKEDALLLLRGFDSIAHNLSQLSNNLDNALQGARSLAEPPTLRDIFNSSFQKLESRQDGLEKKQSKDEEEKTKGLKRKFDTTENSADEGNDSRKEDLGSDGDKKLKKAKNLAISMATKAATLARELKSIRSDLCFTQERCTLLEEENRRLRDGVFGGTRPEEDDLIRLQMEALLAEKSRLANENANLKRENQCLHQLVEYHQITTQDLSASYEEFIQGICLDFSSPSVTEEENHEDDKEVAETPRTNILGLSTSLDKCFQEEEQE